MSQTNRREMLTGKAATQSRFAFRYCSWGGPELGHGLHERQFCLELDSDMALARLEKHRSDSDAEGEPIGLFQKPLQTIEWQRIAELTTSGRLRDLPTGSQGGPGTSVLEFHVDAAEGVFTKTISSRDIPLLQKIDPLVNALNDLLLDMDEHPLASVRAAIHYETAAAERHFVLSLTNVGQQPVFVRDPAGATSDDWAGVRFSPYPHEVPGVTAPPLNWSRLPVIPQRSSASAGLDLRIEPGKTISWRTAPWKVAGKAARYLAQGVFSEYGGPAARDGVYRVRGATFSEAIEITN